MSGIITTTSAKINTEGVMLTCECLADGVCCRKCPGGSSSDELYVISQVISQTIKDKFNSHFHNKRLK